MAMALAVPVLPAVAQVSEVAEIATDGSATIESVDGVIAAVEARDDLDDETRSSVLESLRDARAQILNKQASEQAAIEFSQSLETAPVEADALREQLEDEAGIDVTAEDLGITERTPLAELEQRLAQEQAVLSSLEAELSDLLPGEGVRGLNRKSTSWTGGLPQPATVLRNYAGCATNSAL